ncbi:MAG: hypothetical protein AVDCRST_MAG90-2077 [uncultured Microvirga sp.]|uniref:Uncharacterized protein n=1 Tax=uncultured Microvirga sp. TaxID=412392 RepID=A0A6J4LVU8_9HYPH|nr:MAG: hypothetical protein AVDCRST_MAG90-2077 [uncultured Microvirga sp.]
MCVSPMRSAAVLAGVLGGIFGPLAIDSGLPGVAPAQAKEYYTKKRVNGRWVSGRFAKRDAPKAKAKAAARAVPARVATAAAAPAVGRATDPKPTSVPAPTTLSTAAPAPAAPAVRVDASGSAPVRPAPDVAALAEDGRMRQLQEALQARTQSLLLTSQIATSQNLASNPPSPTARLQEALQARSRDILVTSLIDPAPPAIDVSGPSETASLGPVRGTLPRAELRSVTFDFVSGVKTTVFGDGTAATEAFDTRLARELALRRPPTLN